MAQNNENRIQLESSALSQRHIQGPEASPTRKGTASFCWQRPERLWSTSIIAMAAALSALVGGYVVGYPASSLLDLQNTTIIGDRRFLNNTSADLYGVSQDSIIFKIFKNLTAISFYWWSVWRSSSWFISRYSGTETNTYHNTATIFTGLDIDWCLVVHKECAGF